MELQLRIIGMVLIVLALVHIIFPNYFDWKTQLRSLSIINRQMMYVHSFFIAFMVLLMGLLCLTAAHDLITTPLGKRISLGLSFFWTIRLLVQLFGYSSKIWKGKPFLTVMHVLFSIFWTYLSVVFYLVFAA